MPGSKINVRDSSSEEEVIKTRMAKLTCTNWVPWSYQFENFLISKGMDNILQPPSDDMKETTKFKKKNSRALTLLWSSVSTEFEGVLLNKKSSFYNCWISLGNCCGKNSVVVICCTLHKLINLKYEPASSLEKHIDDFHKVYASYLSISAYSTISMNLSSSMAAAFCLQSLYNDKELSSLCQILYDIRTFDINSVTDRVSIEHCSQKSAYEQHALLFDKNKQAESSKTKTKNQAEVGCKKKGFKKKEKAETTTRAQIMRMKPKNGLKKSSKCWKDFKQLIISHPTPVKKQIHPFSTPVKVTHQGTLDFKGIKLYPVYYVPNGPVNLLSVS
ncbi:hypothetical protein O181_094606 [Austropuccinia psidii MF-1]|uniref:Uncharacterized protein n=1 Tax=Austropuccinia psidii MF-1 TaxID=1389203 RepID=A0A9Q3J3J2_9BASI|nr:hypothetical protein [Austropuccinia psidii MF-1]